MPETPGSLRQRSTAKKRGSSPGSPGPRPEDDDSAVTKALTKAKVEAAKVKESSIGHTIAMTVITLLAFVTRFWKLSHPNQVVFDEVHFGKFASYYLQRTYFFDVHPPFGKLLFALVGWFIGYDGSFLFDNIGDSYITNKVPYVAYRALPATLGALTVPVVYLTMWESGYAVPAALLSAAMICFDNAHIGQTRLILLDATLIFSMALSLLCYVRFYKLRHAPFSRKWWKWLLLTGVSLSCVISTKYVGAFTFFTIGAAVAIDLWNLLDIKKGLTLQEFANHVAARVAGLIVIPFIFYLFWFQVHFAILYKSGPGDDFMTPAFQETLSDNIMTLNSVPVHYYDTITIKHKDTKAFLHSHPERYPLRYEDGRVSSQGQQVTGYPFNDTNNHWVIVPATASDTMAKIPVKHNDKVRLIHVVTNTVLLSHDVASPYYPTNQEFTTVSMEDATGKRANDSTFEIRIEGGKADTQFKTMSGHFKLIHLPSKVAMWTHTKPLPEWAFKQQEINGNKNILQTSNIWFIEDIPSLPEDDPRNDKTPKQVKSLPFLRKYLELQRAMFYHNNALTSSHPYSSHPISWPFLLRGVSFWTKNDTREQIYFIGNPLSWWIASSVLAIFAGIVGADQVTRRRGVDALDYRTRSKLYNSTGFFFLAWSAHYIAFYIMGRQLFLHHYLPAHLASTLVSGAILDFVFTADVNDEIVPAHVANATSKNIPIAQKDGVYPSSPTPANRSTAASWIASIFVITLVVGSFLYFAPLTYGTPGLSVEAVKARKFLNYDLHFAK